MIVLAPAFTSKLPRSYLLLLQNESVSLNQEWAQGRQEDEVPKIQ